MPNGEPMTPSFVDCHSGVYRPQAILPELYMRLVELPLYAGLQAARSTALPMQCGASSAAD
jgi:hypothetical protein